MRALPLVFITGVICLSYGCRIFRDDARHSQHTQASEAGQALCSSDGVCLLSNTARRESSEKLATTTDTSSSFANGTSEGDSPCITAPQNSMIEGAKRLWADSYIFRELPLLNDSGEFLKDQQLDGSLSAAQRIQSFLKIESWYNQPPPEYAGKFVLIEFAASWCGACKRSLKHIEHLHEKYPDKLVVISIFETDAASNNDFPQPGAGRSIKHCIGIDTQRRCANALNVYGIPHALLIEPEAGVIVWEGMVHQRGYELSDELLQKFFAVGLAD